MLDQARRLGQTLRRTWRRLPRLLDEDETPPEIRDVVEAAYALRVSEYNLFRLAFRSWYGREAAEKPLEKIFVAYMFHRAVPPWVRHFCRRVLAEARAGTLRREVFGAGRVPRREPLVAQRREFVGLTMVVLFLGYLLLRAFVG